MGSRGYREHRWFTQPLTPLMEGPEFEMENQQGSKKEKSWEFIKEWFRLEKSVFAGGRSVSSSSPGNGSGNLSLAKKNDLRLLLGVLGCPLAPIPISDNPISQIQIKDIPIETSSAFYIIQQYLAATGCSKQGKSVIKNMFTSGTGLDPKSTASLFSKAQCMGEKRIGEDDCFILKVLADKAAVLERNEGPAEVIRHVLYGYFSQRSGLLIYLEDSHLTRIHSPENDTVYWETTIGSSIGDYRDIDGLLIAHQGRTVATIFRFGETSMNHCRTRMEEIWRIHDVVFNVQGLSIDSFIPPADILDSPDILSP